MRSIHLLILLLGIGPAAPALAQAPLQGTEPAQWRLVWTTDPAHTATLSWSTAEAGRQHRVHLTRADGGEQRAIDASESGRYTSGGESLELYFHHARLSELQPATRYNVVLESDGRRSPELYFVTASDQDVDASILWGGDSRSDKEKRLAMNRLLAGLVADDPAILALAHGGDYIATGTRLSQWSEWLTDHEQTVGADGRLLPIIPARGNHDVGPLFNEVFGFPSGDGNYYATQLARKVLLITLNTETSIAGDQAQWLDRALQRGRLANRWVAAQYHRPAFPAYKLPSAALQHWVPLFDRYRVDLVCEADGHNIKRTVPIRANLADPEGTVYIGEGGLGVKQRTPKSDRWYLQPPGLSDAGYHVQRLDFRADQLRIRVLMLDGTTLDDYTMSPRPPLALQSLLIGDYD